MKVIKRALRILGGLKFFKAYKWLKDIKEGENNGDWQVRRKRGVLSINISKGNLTYFYSADNKYFV